MPPALTVVLECCLFGSLFAFLHSYRSADIAGISPIYPSPPPTSDPAGSSKLDSSVLREVGSRACSTTARGICSA